MKILLSSLLAGVKQFGYKGPDDDAEQMRKFAVDEGIEFDGPDGKPIDIKTVEIETAKSAKRASVSVADAKADQSQQQQPIDINVAVKAAVEAALRSAGIDGADTKRPGFVKSDEPIKVKGSDERAWDAYAATSHGQTFFKSFERVSLFRDMLFADVIARGRHVDREADLSSAIGASRKRLQSGVHGKAYGTFPSEAGGALLATEFRPELIHNVNEFGVATTLARTFPMSQKTVKMPVAKGIPTAYFPEEGTSNTASTSNTFENVQLDAKTSVITARLSRQIVDDANIAILDFFAREFARGFAYKRDTIFFTGDATSTYGGMIGLKAKFEALGTLSAVASTGGGVVVGASSPTTYTAANFTSMIGLCPTYARANARWTCTPKFWANNMLRLSLGQGGSNAVEMVNGVPMFRFMGYPVVMNEIVNAAGTDSANTIDCYFGDFSRASVIGDRMTFEFDTDDSIGFDSYSIAIRGVERYHIVVHDVGSASSPGPVVALVQS